MADTTRDASIETRLRHAARWGAIALLVCALLALRSAGGSLIERRLDRELFVDSFGLQLAWTSLYYMMWASLTPFIFATVRWQPIERGRRFRALLFHLPLSVVVATAAPTILTMLYGGLVLHRGWPEMHTVLTPFWTWLMAARAVSDTLVYWLILGAGHALRVWDENCAKRLRAAELERSLVAAQVDSLKMKLQPHFLFNTLNSISFLAIERDAQAVATVVERLGALLRASMSNGGHVVSLEEEMALLDQYLSIEEIRFKDRLRVTRRVDPAARAAKLPSLALQPIVENSIKHGFSRRLDASRLTIDIAREGESLLVEVTDDGPGLPPGWALETHCGRGLRNLIERLDALYRGAWSFSLANAHPRGTIATLRIPFSRPD